MYFALAVCSCTLFLTAGLTCKAAQCEKCGICCTRGNHAYWPVSSAYSPIVWPAKLSFRRPYLEKCSPSESDIQNSSRTENGDMLTSDEERGDEGFHGETDG